METLSFKTNISTRAAIESVTTALNAIEQVDGWAIEPDGTTNLLTVQTTDNRIADLVTKAVETAGYEASPV